MSVMKMDTMYGCANAVALNGTMLSDYQVNLINELGVNEVIIAVDKDFADYKNKRETNKEELFEKDDELDEDTVKSGSGWTNKGKEGTHGKFKTKKGLMLNVKQCLLMVIKFLNQKILMMK